VAKLSRRSTLRCRVGVGKAVSAANGGDLSLLLNRSDRGELPEQGAASHDEPGEVTAVVTKRVEVERRRGSGDRGYQGPADR
jgi:hypothetical protein